MHVIPCRHLAAMDPNRFQVGVPSPHPSPAPGSQNVLPFRRPAGRGSSNNNTSGGATNSNSAAPQGSDGTAVNAGSNANAAAGAATAAAAADQQQQPAAGSGNSTHMPQQLSFQQPAGSQPLWPPDSIAIPVTAYRQTRVSEPCRHTLCVCAMTSQPCRGNHLRALRSMSQHICKLGWGHTCQTTCCVGTSGTGADKAQGLAWAPHHHL